MKRENVTKQKKTCETGAKPQPQLARFARKCPQFFGSALASLVCSAVRSGQEEREVEEGDSADFAVAFSRKFPSQSTRLGLLDSGQDHQCLNGKREQTTKDRTPKQLSRTCVLGFSGHHQKTSVG